MRATSCDTPAHNGEARPAPQGVEGDAVGSPLPSDGYDPVTTDPKGEASVSVSVELYVRGVTNPIRMQDAGSWQACTHLPSYISGFFDGEGCFSVAIAPRRTMRLGWEVRPSVSASQNADRAQVIHEIHRFFGCGAIRPDPGDRTVKWESRSLGDSVETVIPHFKVYPLRSGKQRDVEAFDTVCTSMLEGRHLEADGLAAIVSIVSTMNPSGRRRYDPDEILDDLRNKMKA